jgi:soluble lytic murein transglycosylase-like protein
MKKALFPLLRRLACASLALGVAFASPGARADVSGYAMRPAGQIQALANSMQCWQAAADYEHVDVWLLYSIAYVESQYTPSAVNRNTNGSRDLGMMQINTIHLPTLARYGIGERELMDPCTSIFVGAWVVRQNLNRYGYTWLGIGAYNSANPSIALSYAKRVYAVHAKLTGLRAGAPGAPAFTSR